MKQKIPKKYTTPALIVVLIVLILLAWAFIKHINEYYPPDCRSLIISWCTNCKGLNWVGGEEVGKGLAWCSNSLYYTGWTPNTDCTVSNAKDICRAFISVNNG